MGVHWLVVAVLGLHGVLHFLGFAKAFGLAPLPQLTQSIARPMGAAWLAAGLLVLASAALFAGGHRRFWIAGAIAVVVSQAVIATAWRDAWAGTLANVLLATVVAHAWLTEGPWSFRAQLLRDAGPALAACEAAPIVTEADLAGLPAPVARYLRVAGVVGQPRVRSYALRFRGRIRSAPDSPWLPFTAEQVSVVDPPVRLFLMRARMRGLPVEAFHRSIGGHATMQVRVAGLVPMADARGDVMDRSEVVTMFNDMSLLAPGALLSPAIAWEAVDDRTARARFANGQTIAATLYFGDDGFLTNFVSDDRSRLSPDNTRFVQQRFSTPVHGFQRFGPAATATVGEGRWHGPEGEFTYGEFGVVDLVLNPR
ncbi:MAG: DUF6544 family protein [Vicinamibacterales bacterium]